MPNFNQTGPKGQGPKTGRKKGHCTNNDEGSKAQPESETPNEKLPENQKMGLGRGAHGRGRGLGLKNRLRGASK
jgi:hypothetical protein